MELKRFHKDVFMPFPKASFNQFWGNIVDIFPTQHFIIRKADRGIPFPALASLKNGEVVEVYANYDGRYFMGFEKVVIRVKGSGRVDFAYVISRKGSIVTAWIAPKSNKYEAIDTSVYERGK